MDGEPPVGRRGARAATDHWWPASQWRKALERNPDLSGVGLPYGTADPVARARVAALIDAAETGDRPLDGDEIDAALSGSHRPEFDMEGGWRKDAAGDGHRVRFQEDRSGLGFQLEEWTGPAGTAFRLWGPDGSLAECADQQAVAHLIDSLGRPAVAGALGREQARAAGGLHHDRVPKGGPGGYSSARQDLLVALERHGLIERAEGDLAATRDRDDFRDLVFARARMLAMGMRTPDVGPDLARALVSFDEASRHAPIETENRLTDTLSEELSALDAFLAAKDEAVAASRGRRSRSRLERTLDAVLAKTRPPEALARDLRRAGLTAVQVEGVVRAANAWRGANARVVRDYDEAVARYGAHRLPPEAAEGLSVLHAKVLEIARRVNPHVDLQLASRLVLDDPEAIARSGVQGAEGPTPVAGYFDRAAQLIRVSLDYGSFDPVETAYHELWHSLENTFNRAEQRILASVYPANGTHDHRERLAYAFGRYAAALDRGETLGVQGAAGWIGDFCGRLGNFLCGDGFQIASDIADSALNGELAARIARQTKLDPDSPRRPVQLLGDVPGWTPAAIGPGETAGRMAASAQRSGPVPDPCPSDPSISIPSFDRAPGQGGETDPRGDAYFSPPGEAAKLHRSIAALHTLNALDAGEEVDAERLRDLAGYSGAGTLAGALNGEVGSHQARSEFRTLAGKEALDGLFDTAPTAFYTDPEVARGIWALLDRLGLESAMAGGKDRLRVLEPGCGSGVFLATAPARHAGLAFTGVEIDPLAARIARELNPGADVVNARFESFSRPDGFYDLAIGNVPFANLKPSFERRYAGQGHSIHERFLRKSLDMVRPGGLVAVLTSQWLMDGQDPKFRETLARDADLRCAIRLPEGVFGQHASTEAAADLIVLQRREEPRDLDVDRPVWVDTRELPAPSVPAPEGADRKGADGDTTDGERGVYRVNGVFLDQPDWVLGRLVAAVTRYPGDKEVRTITDTAPADRASQAAAFIAAATPVDGRSLAAVEPSNPAVVTGGTRSNDRSVARTAWVVEDARPVLRDGLGAGPVLREETDPDRAVVIAHAVSLAAAARDVLAAKRERRDAGPARERANALYDSFVAAHGAPSARGVQRILNDNVVAPLVGALDVETDDPEAPRRKAALLLAEPGSDRAIDSLEAAVATSLDSVGRLDLETVGAALNRSLAEVEAELLKAGLAYRDPADRSLVDSALYLSGDLASKLDLARAAAATDRQYEANVSALSRAMPPPVAWHDIDIAVGAGWIPEELHRAFVADLLHIDEERVELVRRQSTGRLEVDIRGRLAKATVDAYARPGWPVSRVLTAAFSGDHPTVSTKDGLDREATSQLQARIADVRERFAVWAVAEEGRRTAVESAFNRAFRSSVRRGGGEHLTFPSMSDGWAARIGDHQRRAVWGGICGNFGVYHEVGAYKTSTLIATAIEAARMGISSRPLIAVHKSTLNDFANMAREMYPNARIKVLPDTASAEARRRFFAGIAAGEEFDLAIAHHEAVDLVGLSPRAEANYAATELAELLAQKQALLEQGGRAKGRLGRRLQRDIDAARVRVAKYEEAAENDAGSVRHDVEVLESRLAQALEGADAREDDPGVKQIATEIANRRARLEELLASDRRDGTVYFEDLGITKLLVDEAHKFKNLVAVADLGDVRGLPSATSQRAARMTARADVLREEGNTVVFATGTPIGNTIAESWAILRLVEPAVLERAGVRTLSEFANAFFAIEPSVEIGPTGALKEVRRVKQFRNLPELRALFDTCADFVLLDDVPGVKRPGLRSVVDIAPAGPEQRSQMAEIAGRLAAIETRDAPPGDNRLVIATDARKAALDARVLDASAPIEPSSKVERVARNVAEIARNNPGVTQLVFLDMAAMESPLNPGFSFVDALVDRLEHHGMPREKLANFFTAEGAAADRLKEELNSGEKLVGIGSTARLGTGTNVQTRLLAMHDVDGTLNPIGDMQRKGRGRRAGNLNPTVWSIRYVTRGTGDEFLAQLGTNKAPMIETFWRGEGLPRRFDDLEVEDLRYDDLLALLRGDDTVVRRSRLAGTIQSLEVDARVEAARRLEASRVLERANDEERTLGEQYRNRIAAAEDATAALSGGLRLIAEPTGALADGKKAQGGIVAGRNRIGEALMAAVEPGVGNLGRRIGALVGEDGRELIVLERGYGGTGRVTLRHPSSGEGQVIDIDRRTAQGAGQSLWAGVRRIERARETVDAAREDLLQKVVLARALLDTPERYRQLLDTARLELRKLDTAIRLGTLEPDEDTARRATAHFEVDGPGAETHLAQLLDRVVGDGDPNAAKDATAYLHARRDARDRAVSEIGPPELPVGLGLETTGNDDTADRGAVDNGASHRVAAALDAAQASDRPTGTAVQASVIGAGITDPALPTLYGDIPGPALGNRADRFASLEARLPGDEAAMVRALREAAADGQDPVHRLSLRGQALLGEVGWREGLGRAMPNAARDHHRLLATAPAGWSRGTVIAAGGGAEGIDGQPVFAQERALAAWVSEGQPLAVIHQGPGQSAEGRWFAVVDAGDGTRVTQHARLSLREAARIAEDLGSMMAARGFRRWRDVVPTGISPVVRNSALAQVRAVIAARTSPARSLYGGRQASAETSAGITAGEVGGDAPRARREIPKVALNVLPSHPPFANAAAPSTPQEPRTAISSTSDADAAPTAMGSQPYRIIDPATVTTRFRDVIGQSAIVSGLADIADMVRHPEAYRRVGAELPRGILLSSPPGSGKTHSLRALAGEAGVPIVVTAGPDLFKGGLVGDAGQNVRALFEAAREAAGADGAAIIAVDEIDQIGSREDGSGSGRSGASEEVINAFLTEMDGFDQDAASNIVVVGLTNHPERLDPAFVRAGRMSRHLRAEALSLVERAELLRRRIETRNAEPGLDAQTLARSAGQASGAELNAWVNEAAIVAGRERAERITHAHFDIARAMVPGLGPRAGADEETAGPNGPAGRPATRGELVGAIADVLRPGFGVSGRGDRGGALAAAARIAEQGILQYGLGAARLAGVSGEQLSEEGRTLLERERAALLRDAMAQIRIERGMVPRLLDRSLALAREAARLIAGSGLGAGASAAPLYGTLRMASAEKGGPAGDRAGKAADSDPDGSVLRQRLGGEFAKAPAGARDAQRSFEDDISASLSVPVTEIGEDTLFALHPPEIRETIRRTGAAWTVDKNDFLAAAETVKAEVAEISGKDGVPAADYVVGLLERMGADQTMAQRFDDMLQLGYAINQMDTMAHNQGHYGPDYIAAWQGRLEAAGRYPRAVDRQRLMTAHEIVIDAQPQHEGSLLGEVADRLGLFDGDERGYGDQKATPWPVAEAIAAQATPSLVEQAGAEGMVVAVDPYIGRATQGVAMVREWDRLRSKDPSLPDPRKALLFKGADLDPRMQKIATVTLAAEGLPAEVFCMETFHDPSPFIDLVSGQGSSGDWARVRDAAVTPAVLSTPGIADASAVGRHQRDRSMDVTPARAAARGTFDLAPRARHADTTTGDGLSRRERRAAAAATRRAARRGHAPRQASAEKGAPIGPVRADLGLPSAERMAGVEIPVPTDAWAKAATEVLKKIETGPNTLLQDELRPAAETLLADMAGDLGLAGTGEAFSAWLETDRMIAAGSIPGSIPGSVSGREVFDKISAIEEASVDGLAGGRMVALSVIAAHAQRIDPGFVEDLAIDTGYLERERTVIPAYRAYAAEFLADAIEKGLTRDGPTIMVEPGHQDGGVAWGGGGLGSAVARELWGRGHDASAVTFMRSEHLEEREADVAFVALKSAGVSGEVVWEREEGGRRIDVLPVTFERPGMLELSEGVERARRAYQELNRQDPPTDPRPARRAARRQVSAIGDRIFDVAQPSQIRSGTIGLLCLLEDANATLPGLDPDSAYIALEAVAEAYSTLYDIAHDSTVAAEDRQARARGALDNLDAVPVDALPGGAALGALARDLVARSPYTKVRAAAETLLRATESLAVALNHIDDTAAQALPGEDRVSLRSALSAIADPITSATGQTSIAYRAVVSAGNPQERPDDVLRRLEANAGGVLAQMGSSILDQTAETRAALLGPPAAVADVENRARQEELLAGLEVVSVDDATALVRMEDGQTARVRAELISPDRLVEAAVIDAANERGRTDAAPHPTSQRYAAERAGGVPAESELGGIVEWARAADPSELERRVGAFLTKPTLTRPAWSADPAASGTSPASGASVAARGTADRTMGAQQLVAAARAALRGATMGQGRDAGSLRSASAATPSAAAAKRGAGHGVERGEGSTSLVHRTTIQKTAERVGAVRETRVVVPAPVAVTRTGGHGRSTTDVARSDEGAVADAETSSRPHEGQEARQKTGPGAESSRRTARPGRTNPFAPRLTRNPLIRRASAEITGPASSLPLLKRIHEGLGPAETAEALAANGAGPEQIAFVTGPLVLHDNPWAGRVEQTYDLEVLGAAVRASRAALVLAGGRDDVPAPGDVAISTLPYCLESVPPPQVANYIATARALFDAQIGIFKGRETGRDALARVDQEYRHAVGPESGPDGSSLAAAWSRAAEGDPQFLALHGAVASVIRATASAEGSRRLAIGGAADTDGDARRPDRPVRAPLRGFGPQDLSGTARRRFSAEVSGPVSVTDDGDGRGAGNVAAADGYAQLAADRDAADGMAMGFLAVDAETRLHTDPVSGPEHGVAARRVPAWLAPERSVAVHPYRPASATDVLLWEVVTVPGGHQLAGKHDLCFRTPEAAFEYAAQVQSLYDWTALAPDQRAATTPTYVPPEQLQPALQAALADRRRSASYIDADLRIREALRRDAAGRQNGEREAEARGFDTTQVWYLAVDRAPAPELPVADYGRLGPQAVALTVFTSEMDAENHGHYAMPAWVRVSPGTLADLTNINPTLRETLRAFFDEYGAMIRDHRASALIETNSHDVDEFDLEAYNLSEAVSAQVRQVLTDPEASEEDKLVQVHRAISEDYGGEAFLEDVKVGAIPYWDGALGYEEDGLWALMLEHLQDEGYEAVRHGGIDSETLSMFRPGSVEFAWPEVEVALSRNLDRARTHASRFQTNRSGEDRRRVEARAKATAGFDREMVARTYDVSATWWVASTTPAFPDWPKDDGNRPVTAFADAASAGPSAYPIYPTRDTDDAILDLRQVVSNTGKAGLGTERERAVVEAVSRIHGAQPEMYAKMGVHDARSLLEGLAGGEFSAGANQELAEATLSTLHRTLPWNLRPEAVIWCAERKEGPRLLTLCAPADRGAVATVAWDLVERDLTRAASDLLSLRDPLSAAEQVVRAARDLGALDPVLVWERPGATSGDGQRMFMAFGPSAQVLYGLIDPDTAGDRPGTISLRESDVVQAVARGATDIVIAEAGPADSNRIVVKVMGASGSVDVREIDVLSAGRHQADLPDAPHGWITARPDPDGEGRMIVDTARLLSAFDGSASLSSVSGIPTSVLDGGAAGDPATRGSEGPAEVSFAAEDFEQLMQHARAAGAGVVVDRGNGDWETVVDAEPAAAGQDAKPNEAADRPARDWEDSADAGAVSSGRHHSEAAQSAPAQNEPVQSEPAQSEASGQAAQPEPRDSASGVGGASDGQANVGKSGVGESGVGESAGCPPPESNLIPPAVPAPSVQYDPRRGEGPMSGDGHISMPAPGASRETTQGQSVPAGGAVPASSFERARAQVEGLVAAANMASQGNPRDRVVDTFARRGEVNKSLLATLRRHTADIIPLNLGYVMYMDRGTWRAASVMDALETLGPDGALADAVPPAALDALADWAGIAGREIDMPDVDARLDELATSISAIAHQVAPHVDLRLTPSLYSGVSGSRSRDVETGAEAGRRPILGAYFEGMGLIAIRRDRSQHVEMVRSAGHELFHTIDELFDAEERSLLTRRFGDVTRNEHANERAAEAFGAYVAERLSAEREGRPVPEPVGPGTGFFAKLENFRAGLGFRTWADVMADTYEGRIGDRFKRLDMTHTVDGETAVCIATAAGLPQLAKRLEASLVEEEGTATKAVGVIAKLGLVRPKRREIRLREAEIPAVQLYRELRHYVDDDRFVAAVKSIGYDAVSDDAGITPLAREREDRIESVLAAASGATPIDITDPRRRETFVPGLFEHEDPAKPQWYQLSARRFVESAPAYLEHSTHQTEVAGRPATRHVLRWPAGADREVAFEKAFTGPPQEKAVVEWLQAVHTAVVQDAITLGRDVPETAVVHDPGLTAMRESELRVAIDGPRAARPKPFEPVSFADVVGMAAGQEQGQSAGRTAARSIDSPRPVRVAARPDPSWPAQQTSQPARAAASAQPAGPLEQNETDASATPFRPVGQNRRQGSIADSPGERPGSHAGGRPLDGLPVVMVPQTQQNLARMLGATPVSDLPGEVAWRIPAGLPERNRVDLARNFQSYESWAQAQQWLNVPPQAVQTAVADGALRDAVSGEFFVESATASATRDMLVHRYGLKPVQEVMQASAERNGPMAGRASAPPMARDASAEERPRPQEHARLAEHSHASGTDAVVVARTPSQVSQLQERLASLSPEKLSEIAAASQLALQALPWNVDVRERDAHYAGLVLLGQEATARGLRPASIGLSGGYERQLSAQARSILGLGPAAAPARAQRPGAEVG